MSWSIRAVGRASKVAAKYRESADAAKISCKNIPPEVEAIEHSAQVVETLCAGLGETPVDVTGSGSCSQTGDGTLTAAGFAMNFNSIYFGFAD